MPFFNIDMVSPLIILTPYIQHVHRIWFYFNLHSEDIHTIRQGHSYRIDVKSSYSIVIPFMRIIY